MEKKSWPHTICRHNLWWIIEFNKKVKTEKLLEEQRKYLHNPGLDKDVLTHKKTLAMKGNKRQIRFNQN